MYPDGGSAVLRERDVFTTDGDIDVHLGTSIAALEPTRTALAFWRQQELVVLDRFIPPDLLARMGAEAERLEGEVVRRQVTGYKRAGAVSYRKLFARAPSIIGLYRSPAFIGFLSDLCELPLLTCPDWDAHACALYQYDAPGDHVGFHYDTSWYQGARFTVLIGLWDTSSSRLRCRLYSREAHRPCREMDVATKPGTLVFFNGDKLLHGVTPLGYDERRVVLSLQYVTNREMRPWKRFITHIKDSVAYFGFSGGNGSPARLPAPRHLGEAP